MVITKDENMPISQLIGYMLKVIKSKKDTSGHNKKFNAIKHGNYDCFYDLIREPQHDIAVQWMKGNIKTDNFFQRDGDADITMLHKIEPSIVKFFEECYKLYGDHSDTDIPNLTCCKCAAFEIALRGHKNKERQNRNLPYTNIKLQECIKEVCLYYDINYNEEVQLHQGRDFVNMIKGHERRKGVPYFSSWQEGLLAFDIAWEICNKYQLKLCY